MDDDRFNTIPGLAALRRLDFVSVTPQYPYLLHGVLAASALYLASTRREESEEVLEQYKAKAIRHQQFALSSYIRSLRTINAESCQFIFGFSIILAGLQLAFYASPTPAARQTLQADALIDNVLGVFNLMLGAVSVADEASKWIPACRKEPLLLPIRTMLQYNDVKIEDENDAAFSALLSMIRSVQNGSGRDSSQLCEEATVCLSAATNLRGVFNYLKEREIVKYKVVLGWLAFVDRSFIALIRARRPMALIVLSYYGVALHEIGSAWWLQSIGVNLALAVDGSLHSSGASTLR